MTAVEGPIVRARRAGYFDMVATADALAGDPALRARAAALAGGDPLRRGDGRVAAMGLSVAACSPTGACCSGAAAPASRSTRAHGTSCPRGCSSPGPTRWRRPSRARRREELGVDGRPGRRARARARLGPRAPAARGVRRAGVEAAPARAGGDEFDVVEAFDVARAPAPLTAGAACALALLGRVRARSRATGPASGGEHQRPRKPVRVRNGRATAGPGATFAWWSPSTPNSARSASRWPPCAGGRPTAPSPCSPGSARRARRSCSSARSTTSTRASRSRCRAAGSAIRATAGASWPSAPASRSPPASTALLAYSDRSSTSGRAARAWLLERHGPSRSSPRSTATRARAARGTRDRARADRRGGALVGGAGRAARRAAVPRGARRPRRGRPRGSTAPTARARSRRCARTPTR